MRNHHHNRPGRNRPGSVLLLVMLIASTGGCGGNVNVQASGGGAGGFASLGAIILGTSALRYLRGNHDPVRKTPEEQDDPALVTPPEISAEPTTDDTPQLQPIKRPD
ncbi:MAG: hypothetical protein WD572_09590 [Gammaproteobacteria bacterium]